jgi:threonine synthase
MSTNAIACVARDAWTQRCVVCGSTWGPREVRYRCSCGETLEIVHDADGPARGLRRADIRARRASLGAADRSGVWRFRELVLPVAASECVARGEGNTGLYDVPRVASFVGLDAIALKHEGENPTGSFKDRGMTVGVTMAKRLGFERVACASTGNTSASMASYAALAGLKAFVFLPAGAVSFGKLAQALAYGATTLSIRGNFDDAMRLVEETAASEGIYLLNSVNPYRLEGQKAIAFELLEQRGWRVPDWIVVPGGNLGNSSAMFKGLLELRALGWIRKMPRFAVVQAAGANPLVRTLRSGSSALQVVSEPETIATAIRIGQPVSWRKCLRAIAETDGVVEDVTDAEILEAKAVVDAAGVGAEPASCASVAGARKLVQAGVIPSDADVVAVLTGHVLKDPDAVAKYHTGADAGPRANRPIEVDATAAAVARAIRATVSR